MYITLKDVLEQVNVLDLDPSEWATEMLQDCDLPTLDLLLMRATRGSREHMMVATFIKKGGGTGPDQLPRVDQFMLDMPEGLSQQDKDMWLKEQQVSPHCRRFWRSGCGPFCTTCDTKNN